MSDVDGQQDARLDRLDTRLRAVEEVVIELRALTKMVKPILLMLAASLGVDVAPMLV
jgi:hypothetical protein